jgi:hypothetical protein
LLDYRPEYSALATFGDKIWRSAINPVLRTVFGRDKLTALIRIRLSIQGILVAAVALTPFAFWFRSGPALNAAGLLFDIAGVVRVFLLEEIDEALTYYEEKDKLPSVAMREFIMPEAPNVDLEDDGVSHFYYRKRGVLFLFIGFMFQMLSDLI